MLCCQTTLPEHHRTLALEWLISWPQQDTPTAGPQPGGEGEVGGGGDEGARGTEAAAVELEQQDSLELKLRQRALKPTMFDSLGTK